MPKKFALAAFFLLLSSGTAVIAQNKPLDDSYLKTNFKTPPDSVKLSVYWYWLNDNISKEGVEKDLDAMVKAGIGRAYIGNMGLSGFDSSAYGKVKLLSNQWWSVTKDAIRYATKVGVDVGIFNGPGWSQSGGPWIKPGQSMRYLAKYRVKVSGPQKFNQLLPDTIKDFQDVAVIAFPQPAEQRSMASYQPKITASLPMQHMENLVDDKISTETVLTATLTQTDRLTIDISLNSLFTANSLAIYPGKQTLKADCELQAADNGVDYHTVQTFVYDRSNPNINVGFIPYSPVLVSFAPVKAAKFRLIFNNMQGNGSLAEIKLLAGPKLERYPEKQLAKMFQTPQALWSEYQWKDQPEPLDKNSEVDPEKVINISKFLVNGTLNWQVPPGNWVIMRLGMVPTGVTNGPASPEGTGLEVDKMNKTPIESHFNAFLGRILDSLPPAERKSFKYTVADSYETGSQNWTDGFVDEFKNAYGYSPLPWLPVLNGDIVGSVTQSNRFMWDWRRQVANDIAYNYVGGLREVSHKHGLHVWLENYGHWGFPAEFLQYGGQSDEVSGEFWAEGGLGTIELKAASSAAHIYGKNIVFAESFTAGGLPFVRYPGMIKKKGDWAFTEGINKTLLHVMISQPYDDKNPGVNAWFGTEFNRKNTWFGQGKAFFDYMRRCNFLLQQGRPVVDVAYFVGEDAPKMTGIRDPALPKGYFFDYINAEVIEHSLTVKNGKLVLPDGIAYSMLVLPKIETMRPELLSKIKDLIAAGGIVVGPAPKRSPSLQNYPQADHQITKMANEVWGNTSDTTSKVSKFVLGKILTGMDMQAALNYVNTPPDFDAGNGKPLIYIHRSAPGMDIYFISNQSDTVVNASAIFRVFGEKPELWDAVNGTSRILPEFKQTDKGVIVPLKLAGSQSAFIVFKKVSIQKAATAAVNFPAPKVISKIKGAWQVKFDVKMRGPKNAVKFDTLADWTKRPEDSIKYYSGTAVYYKDFNVGKIAQTGQVYIDLGALTCMAKVRLNGIDVGIAWTPPYLLDITQAVKPGINHLQVEVVNTWVNRLVGDSRLPKDQVKTWTNVSGYTPQSPLQASGLLGPVSIKTIKY